MHLAFRQGIDQEGVIRVGMKIDKARRQRQSCAIDDHASLWRRERPDLSNGITEDGHIADERWRPTPIDDPSLLNQHIPHRTHPSASTEKPLSGYYNFHAL